MEREDGVQIWETPDGRFFALHPTGKRSKEHPLKEEALFAADTEWQTRSEPQTPTRRPSDRYLRKVITSPGS